MDLMETSFFERCKILKDFQLLKDKFFSNGTVTDDDFTKNMNWLKPNKAHRHDMIRINMLKRQRSSLCNPLGLIYYPNTSTQIKDYSLMFGKTIKSIPVHKKPVSLSYWFVENLYSTTLFLY